MELQKHYFWILKGHSTINCPKEFKPDVLNVRHGFKNSNFTKNVWAHQLFCHTEILQFLKANFSSDITPKEPNISPITKIHKLKCL